MKPSPSLLRSLAGELALLLDPIVVAAQSSQAMERLLEELGVHAGDTASLAGVFGSLIELKTQIENLAAQDELDFAAAEAALQAAGSAFDLINAISDVEGTGTAALQGIGRDLIDLLLETWLANRHPIAREVLALLTLLEDHVPSPPLLSGDTALRAPVRLDRLRLDRLPALLRDPVGVLKAYYANALATDQDAQAMADRLFPRLVQVLRGFGISARYGFRPDDEPQLGDAAPLMKPAMIVYAVDPLRLVDEGTPLPTFDREAGVVLALSPASRGDLGLVVAPFGALGITRGFDRWVFESSVSGQVDVLAWGRHGLTLLAQAGDAQITANVAAHTAPSEDGGPAHVLGARDGTRIELGSIRLAAALTASTAEQTLALSADVTGAALVLAPSGSDGFLASVLPSQGLRAELDLGLAWSSDGGLTLHGSSSLEAQLPVRLSLGGLSLSAVHLALQPQDDRVRAEVSADASVSVGPVRAVINRMGLDALLSFPPQGGNLGAADLALGFKPPSGIGLSIDAGGAVTGGGFLFHDKSRGLYAGSLELTLHDRIALKAFGLIATRLPDGTRGYSLLVFITADGFRPIQLGLGFTLLGIGGMVAVHRTFDEAVLRSGLKNGTLESLLFPRDPVGNADGIIRAVAAAFPARSGSYLVGLLARIGWFTPTLVVADLALIVEFGARKRILVLGRVRAALPSPEHALLRINLDAIGVFDLEAGTAAIDAVLVDSRLLERFAITGAAALRARWSRPRSFALAIGGMNKGFTLPAEFPQLERVMLSLTTGENPRLTCRAYFALTSNTVQFGAAAYLYAAAHGFSVTGEAGFDVLIQLAPFHFLAEFFAGMQLKRGSSNLFKVKVEGALEGPAPLTVRAKCTFEILWWDVSIRVNATLAGGVAPPLPAAVNVLAQLQAALRDARNWSAELPSAQTRVVTLVEAPAGVGLRVHPLAMLAVRQAVVPLNLARDIDRFGDAPVAGARRFALGPALLGGQAVSGGAIGDDFAPAQFFDMSDDDKLAAPQYETMDAGVAFGTPASTLDLAGGVASALEFETKLVDRQAARDETPPPYRLDAALLALHARFGAAGRSVLRSTAPASGAVPFAALRKSGFAVVDETLASVTPPAAALSFAEARSLARAAPARRHAVPAFEVVA